MNHITIKTFYYFCNKCNKMLTSYENKYTIPITEFIKQTNLSKGKVTSLLTHVEIEECQEKINCIQCQAIKG